MNFINNFQIGSSIVLFIIVSKQNNVRTYIVFGGEKEFGMLQGGGSSRPK